MKEVGREGWESEICETGRGRTGKGCSDEYRCKSADTTHERSTRNPPVLAADVMVLCVSTCVYSNTKKDKNL
jgi:hypothetical protein